MTRFLGDYFALVVPFWRSADKLFAWGTLFLLVSMNLGVVYLEVRFNQWNAEFFNAIQGMQQDAFWLALGKLGALAFVYIVVVVYLLYFTQMMELRLRTWMTDSFLVRWMDDDVFYRMRLYPVETDNPDQRISEDVRLLGERSIALFFSLLRSTVSLVSFTLILWRISGPLDFALFGHDIHIPGYMLIAAILYSAIGIWATTRIGGPLAVLNSDQQRYEADFRFGLGRLREYSEEIAVYRGENRERKASRTRFDMVAKNFLAIMRRKRKLSWLTSSYTHVAFLFPFVVASPRYFAGLIQLGVLMQISAAFQQVHGSLSFLVTSWVEIAELKAVTERLRGFEADMATMRERKTHERLERGETDDASLEVDGLTLEAPDGRPLARDLVLKLESGDRLLVAGPSGSGKSTLLRALAGVWPFCSGRARLPAPLGQRADGATGHGAAMFLSQNPYIPLGALREALFYPRPPRAGPDIDAELKDYLSLCGLERLGDKLDVSDNWAGVLSLGERQRVALIRVFLARPAVLFLDEATASLDEAAEADMYKALLDRLPDSILVSVGHRSTLKVWHSRRLLMTGDAADSLGWMPVEPLLAT